jgi:aspartate carbamoyltransferase regulatory subunit
LAQEIVAVTGRFAIKQVTRLGALPKVDTLEMRMPVRYAHILVFTCPDCDLPIAISRVSKEKNLENINAEVLRLKCSYCEKASSVRAVYAKRRYVDEWPPMVGGS